QVDGHRLRRGEGPQPAAGHGRAGHARGDRAGPVRDPHPAAGAHQRGLRPDARGQVHPYRDPLLRQAMERIEHRACFGGWQDVYRHRSQVLGCDMNFAVYLPPQAAQPGARLPVLYWLSGLTCTEQNFITKAGAQRYAAEHGIVVVAPDTSPRGEDVADDPGYDLGQGAGFYLNATCEPWARHYRMHDYVA